MKLARILSVLAVVAVVLPTQGACSLMKGACVMKFDASVFCKMTSKSVCEQGKGDTWVGGECKDAGYTKAGKDDTWDK
jgi:hypothetical protein